MLSPSHNWRFFKSAIKLKVIPVELFGLNRMTDMIIDTWRNSPMSEDNCLEFSFWFILLLLIDTDFICRLYVLGELYIPLY